MRWLLPKMREQQLGCRADHLQRVSQVVRDGDDEAFAQRRLGQGEGIDRLLHAGINGGIDVMEFPAIERHAVLVQYIEYGPPEQLVFRDHGLVAVVGQTCPLAAMLGSHRIAGDSIVPGIAGTDGFGNIVVEPGKGIDDDGMRQAGRFPDRGAQAFLPFGHDHVAQRQHPLRRRRQAFFIGVLLTGKRHDGYR